ncbi:unnamed protein product, partial [marine sediment metagenome]
PRTPTNFKYTILNMISVFSKLVNVGRPPTDYDPGGGTDLGSWNMKGLGYTHPHLFYI